MSTESVENIKKIELRNLEPVLQQSFGKELIVESFTSESLLPPGENYGSTILSIHAVIRKNSNAESEHLYLIAKMVPPTDFQRRVFDSPFTFRKEIYMYQNLVPSYNRLEMECNVKENEIFDILPKLYGSRLSLDPNVDFDDNAVILLENLKVRGYYTGKRYQGYDLEHSKVAIRAMAKFHALGIATKYKKPNEFKELKEHSKCIDIKTDDFVEPHLALLKIISEDPYIKEHSERCLKALTNEIVIEAWTASPKEPWGTIVHSDFWVNNIMFHRDQDGHVDDIKFIDFQNYLYSSPFREMVFYLFSSVNDEVHNNNIDELIDLYHNEFLQVLNKMGCNLEEFSRDKFNVQLPFDAKFEFVHLCFMLKVLTLDVRGQDFDCSKIKAVMIDYKGNKVFIERLRRLVSCFIKRNWI